MSFILLASNWVAPFPIKLCLPSTNKHQGWTTPASIKRVCLSNLLSHLAAVNTKWPCRRDTHYRQHFVKWFSAVRSPHVKHYLSLLQRFIQDTCRWAQTWAVTSLQRPRKQRAPFPLVTRLCLCSGWSLITVASAVPPRTKATARPQEKGGRVGSAHTLSNKIQKYKPTFLPKKCLLW